MGHPSLLQAFLSGFTSGVSGSNKSLGKRLFVFTRGTRFSCWLLWGLHGFGHNTVVSGASAVGQTLLQLLCSRWGRAAVRSLVHSKVVPKSLILLTPHLLSPVYAVSTTALLLLFTLLGLVPFLYFFIFLPHLCSLPNFISLTSVSSLIPNTLIYRRWFLQGLKFGLDYRQRRFWQAEIRKG